MDEELKKILMDFSMALHGWEEKNPDKDLPKNIDKLWEEVTAILEKTK